MRRHATELRSDDVIEVMYRSGEIGQSARPRWIRGIITYCEAGTWPLGRLADGQLTEIRPYMKWKLVAKARDLPPAT